jgi:hypothetical protein
MDTWRAYEEMLDIKDLIEYLNAELFNTMGWLDLLLRPGMTIDKFRKTIEGIENLGLTTILDSKEFEKQSIGNISNGSKKAMKRIRPDKTSREAFKITKRKVIHYWPPENNFTTCGLDNKNNTIQATYIKRKVTCKTCLRVMKDIT